ncbi:ABC transporter permease [Sorangium sp. So ce426]|uniref:ABC transporter permease n=1 Tax=Sorangium sp. So ce426 TaxID=3133312 RepID=UPI003F5C8A01
MTQQGIQESQTQAGYKLAAPDVALPAGGASRLLSRKVGNVAVGLVFPAALLLAWSYASQRELIPAQILPAPGLVVQTLTELASSGDLHTNIAISFGRVLGGFAAGGAAGLALGIAMGLSRRIEEHVHPLFKALAQVPALAWLPLVMMVAGIGESLKLILIAQASLIPVAINTFEGIKNVPRSYIEVARVFRFSHAQLLRKVVLPAAVPSIAVGVRYGLTQAWLSLVTVELLASSEGVGFLIVWGRQLFQLDVVLAAILVVGIVGLALDKGLEAIEARLLRWRRAAL